jgi:hypothetical protein
MRPNGMVCWPSASETRFGVVPVEHLEVPLEVCMGRPRDPRWVLHACTVTETLVVSFSVLVESGTNIKMRERSFKVPSITGSSNKAAMRRQSRDDQKNNITHFRHSNQWLGCDSRKIRFPMIPGPNDPTHSRWKEGARRLKRRAGTK